PDYIKHLHFLQQLTHDLTSSSAVGVSRDQRQKDTSSLLVLRRLVRLHLREKTVWVNYPAEKMHRPALLDVCVLAVLVLVLVLAPRTEAQQSEAPDRVCYGTRNRPARGGICGSAIPNAVASVCGRAGKRSGGATDTIDFSQFKKVERTRSFDLEKRDAFEFLQKRSSFTGIVCECCYNTWRKEMPSSFYRSGQALRALCVSVATTRVVSVSCASTANEGAIPDTPL
ncbi:hypothetical protein EGW08_017384, partial [Elysia chlorotica]